MDFKTWWLNNGEQILKRCKSFVWRLGCVMAIAGLNWIANNLGIFNLPPLLILMIGSVCGEATKWINTNTNLFGIKQK